VSVFARWFGRGGKDAPLDARRWIVLDVETTGLDVHHDQLLAVAAVALHFDDDDDRAAPRIALADSFEAVLQHASPSVDKDNILVHGIGVGAQRAGAPPREVLAEFERWIDRAPLVAWHAGFDRAMIGRAVQQHLQQRWSHPWLDLAPVAVALQPPPDAAARDRARRESLDDWLDRFGIDCTPRHQAAADTLATAELLLRLWPAARARGCARWDALVALDRERRWLSG
jgi:DNA polymerase-3 subunit epsilon